jgi:hypothetical protein
MAGLINKLSIAASVAVGIGAIGTAPALAGSLTDPQVNGTHLTYDADDTNTFLTDNTAQNWQKALLGGGNIELGGNTTHAGTADFQNATTLTGLLNGQEITFSSLTEDDWNSDLDGNGKSLKWDWFDAAWNNLDSGLKAVSPAPNKAFAFFGWGMKGGFQRFSDPNIASVSQDENGYISFALAGHLNHETGLKMSEVVKVEYGGKTDYFYAFGQGEDSGLVDRADGVSHSALYSFGFQPEVSVPEPSTMLGLMAVGGLLGASKKRKANKENAEV